MNVRSQTVAQARLSVRRFKHGSHNEFAVLLLESLMTFPQLVGHQLVLIPLLLTRVQLLGQDQEGFFLALQLLLTNQELSRVQKGEGKHPSLQRKDIGS